ncbi:MAG: Txe/YoeB family addiction module toxin [Ignavibacteriaceae bacterium]|nr:Txe/YoeB family addiction module toxin [Ignavibacteriaceae bacterium]
MTWKLTYSKQANKDYQKIKKTRLDKQVSELLDILQKNPFRNPPGFEKLLGDLEGIYSRRINIQHRLIYEVDIKTKTVYVIRMWTHYE